MAIIVDKEEKRQNIALSCRELLLEKGIKSLTISQIAQTAGVGKGTIYEYFKNKEDIVFAIITTFIAEHEKRLKQLVSDSQTTREKLFHFFYLLFEDELSHKHLKIYKEFLSISLLDAPVEMLEFSAECQAHFTEILSQIIDPKDYPHLSLGALTLFGTGLVVDSRLESVDVAKEINGFLDMILISEKKENR